jgi:pimeloyl-ACP methyl ester carboxylesterase
LLGIATRLAASHPDYLMHMGNADPSRLSADVLHALRPFYFSADVPAAVLAEASRHFSAESPRALFDLSLRLHWALPQKNHRPTFVLGAENDLICSPEDVRATARHHNVDATILPGLAHLLMLEPEWQQAAKALEAWIRTLD